MKLNLGSGDCPLDGFTNLDAKRGQVIFPLSFPDNTVDEARASHVLEHFPHHQTLDVLKEWVRVLKPGGWLKIAVPDFDYIVDGFRGEVRVDAGLLEAYAYGGQTDENDYHKALFDMQKLHQLLEAAGLKNIRGWTSEIQDCAALPVSLNLMGQKPRYDRPEEEIDGWAEQIKSPVFVEQEYPLQQIEERMQLGGPLAQKKPLGKLKTLPTSRTQVFAAGRWQDLYDGANIDVADEDELAAANAGQLQTRTIVSDGKRAVKIALCLSTPRQGFLRPFERLLALAHQASISIFSGDGVFWHHALSRSIRNAVEFDFEDGSDGFDFILTADYDTYAMVEDIKALAELLARSPEADCIVPMQMKRGGTGEILAGGQNMNLTQALVPIETGHFGLTIFRKSFFERMPKPWFYEKPDVEGHWGEGRIDADIGFWLNAKKAKLNVMLAPGIVAGHGEELITYPRIVNGKPEKVYQAVNDWLNVRTKPEGIGVQ